MVIINGDIFFRKFSDVSLSNKRDIALEGLECVTGVTMYSYDSGCSPRVKLISVKEVKERAGEISFSGYQQVSIDIKESWYRDLEVSASIETSLRTLRRAIEISKDSRARELLNLFLEGGLGRLEVADNNKDIVDFQKFADWPTLERALKLKMELAEGDHSALLRMKSIADNVKGKTGEFYRGVIERGLKGGMLSYLQIYSLKKLF